MFLILFVLNDPEKLDDLLDAWEAAGVPGVTILHSSGLGRIRQMAGLRDDQPLIPSLESLLDQDEEETFSRTIFSAVETDALVDQVVAATQTVVGNLSQPNTGFLMVLPVLRAYGLNKQY
jgi:nitrogen regulatory protein PII